MRRRSFLGAAAAATVPAAGCLEDGLPADSGDDGATAEPAGTTDEPSATSEATSGGRTLDRSTFEVTNVRCGTDFGRHDVSTSGDTVTVRGVVGGRNTCYTAELVRGDYERASDTLHVAVEATESNDAAACGQCLVEVHYTATFEFDEGTPSSVAVEHRGATTTSGSSGDGGTGSATASDDATPSGTAGDADGY
jgi:hypothetical protein